MIPYAGTRSTAAPSIPCAYPPDLGPDPRSLHSQGLTGVTLELDSLDLEEIGNALADQNCYEHQWLIDPETGKIAFWTEDTGIDGQTPVDLEELHLICISPLPSSTIRNRRAMIFVQPGAGKGFRLEGTGLFFRYGRTVFCV